VWLLVCDVWRGLQKNASVGLRQALAIDAVLRLVAQAGVPVLLNGNGEGHCGACEMGRALLRYRATCINDDQFDQ
jgi:hypothetical protein